MPRIDRTGWCALEISRLKPLLQAGGVKRSPGRALVVLLVLQLVACATGQDGDAANASTITGDDAWTFEGTPAWQDEFDYTGRPDPAKWGHDLGGDGWGNHELQAYTDRIDNASVGDGVLTITAHRQDGGANGYTSARLVSKGKGDFLYGRIEERAKLPTGRGTWPAIWMLPTGQAHGGRPASGENDIMEHDGRSEEHKAEHQAQMRTQYAGFCVKKTK